MFGGGSFIRRAPRAPEWLRRHPDRVAIAGLILLATALFAIPALNGTLVLPGDDLFQNEPLRVLTGSILRSGRLPAWDPLIWSGTPLLAGWNAGAMFPGTWLFAAVPTGLAWTVNLALAYAVCSTGAHLLLRRIGVGPIPALLGALIFTYTGFMNGQVVHVGLIQGTAFTPWILIALEMLADARERRQVAGAIALLGAASSLAVLAGDPRAATSAAIIAGIWFLGRIVRGVTDLARYVASVATGVVLGVALSSIQWIPGIGFLHSSQRANAAYSFFSGGSFDLKTLGLNLLVPYLIGGNGNFGLPIYTGGYNLPEVTIGAGLVSLVAAGAYLPTALGAVVRRVRRRAHVPGVRPLGTAYALIGVGVLLALGGTTPLGHLLVHLPLYGGERLQNRNAVIFDLGLSLLVAFLIEDVLDRRGARAKNGTSEATAGVLSSWPSILLGAIAPLAGALLIAGAYFWPTTIGVRLDVNGVGPSLFRKLGPYLVPSLVAAVALLGFVLVARRLPHRARVAGVIGFVLVDLLTFLTGMGLLTIPTSAVSSSNATSTALSRLQGPNGRSAIYNAASISFGRNPLAEEQVGVTDLNLLRDIPSVQGYGSIVNSDYENETDTHLFEDIGVSALDGPTDLRHARSHDAPDPSGIPRHPDPVPIRHPGRAREPPLHLGPERPRPSTPRIGAVSDLEGPVGDVPRLGPHAPQPPLDHP
jgi:hypothetical protein